MTKLWGEDIGLSDIFQCRQASMELYVDARKTIYYDLSSVADKISATFAYRKVEKYVILNRVSFSDRISLLGVCSFKAFPEDSGVFKFLMLPENTNHCQTFQQLIKLMEADKLVVGEVALREWLESDPFFRKFSYLFDAPERTSLVPVMEVPLVKKR